MMNYIHIETSGHEMPLNPRILILRAHILEMIVSIGCMAAGLVMWVSMNGSNSEITLLVGAALMVAGVIVFGSAMKTILKY
jgi:hypothetical protein